MNQGVAPWIQTAWPRWARRAFSIYVGVLALLFGAMFLLLIVATLFLRFG